MVLSILEVQKYSLGSLLSLGISQYLIMGLSVLDVQKYSLSLLLSMEVSVLNVKNYSFGSLLSLGVSQYWILKNIRCIRIFSIFRRGSLSLSSLKIFVAFVISLGSETCSKLDYVSSGVKNFFSLFAEWQKKPFLSHN